MSNFEKMGKSKAIDGTTQQQKPAAFNNVKTIEEALLVKIKALKEISESLFNKKNDAITDSEICYCMWAASVINSPLSNMIQVTACAAILDMLLPEWRVIAPGRVLGRVIDRNDPLAVCWREMCIVRYGNACVNCGSTKDLAVHHIAQWAEYPELRIEMANGKTLCGNCHHKEHSAMALAMFVKSNIHANA